MNSGQNRYVIEKNAAGTLQQLKAIRKPQEDLWANLKLHADGQVPISKKNPHQAKCRSSELSTTGYRLARHVQRVFTDTQQRMRFSTYSPIKGEGVQESLRMLVDYWLNENKFIRMLPKIIREAYFSSYYILRVYPDPMFKRRPVVREIPEMASIMPKGFGYEVGYAMTPGIRIQHISPYDFWLSTDGDVRVCRYSMNPQDFLAYARDYLRIAGVDIGEVIKELDLKREKDTEVVPGTSAIERDQQLGQAEVYYSGGAPVELYHFEGNLAGITNNDKHVGAAMTLAQVKGGNMRLIEPPAPSPYWDGSASDYVYGSPFIEGFYPYPRSLFADYKSYAQHQTELYNLMVDGTGLRVVPPYELDPRFWGDPNHPGGSSRYLYPGRALQNPELARGNEAVRMLQMPEMPQSVLQVYWGLERKLQELAVNEITKGLPTSKGRPTATEISFKSGYTEENRLDYVENIEETLIEPLVLKLVALTAQFQYDFRGDPDMIQLLGARKCEDLDHLKIDDRIEIAQATRSIQVRAMSETARSQRNVEALTALMSVIAQLPKEALAIMTSRKTSIDMAEFIKLALDGMPFDTTKLVVREDGQQQGQANIIEMLMQAKERGGGLEQLRGTGSRTSSRAPVV